MGDVLARSSRNWTKSSVFFHPELILVMVGGVIPLLSMSRVPKGHLRSSGSGGEHGGRGGASGLPDRTATSWEEGRLASDVAVLTTLVDERLQFVQILAAEGGGVFVAGPVVEDPSPVDVRF